jgi:SAM-dependent methyltransferase
MASSIDTGSSATSARSIPDSTFRKWVEQGAQIHRFEHVRGEYPFLVREDHSDGRHWIHARQDVAIGPGAELEFTLTVRSVDLPAVRLRVDIGGAAVINGTVKFDEMTAQPDEFALLTVNRTPDGLFQIRGLCDSPAAASHVNFGLMFDRGNQCYDYPGDSAGLIVESVSLAVSNAPADTASGAPAKRGPDPGTHSRHSKYGRPAYRLCRGKGLEIGALHRPFDLDAHVTYLDYDKTANLRRDYRKDETVGHIPQVQLVWRGVVYPFIDDNAFDFVINSHVLEHVANPGRVIEEWLRVIRPGGVLYMVVPDKDYTFDRPRALTSIAHLMEDFESRLDRIPLEHYEDHVRNRENPVTTGAEELIRKAFEQQSSIHVHTFTADSLRLFLGTLKPHLGFEIEHFEPQGMHIHVALRKAAAAPV